MQVTHRDEISASHRPEDLIDGRVGRQRAVNDGEVSLETLRDVVTAAARVDHGAHHLDVDDVRKLARLLQVIETFLLNHLSRDLIGHLRLMTYIMQEYVVLKCTL